jgi:hypothetical protein
VNNHITNRARIVQDLKEELVGPSPQGKEIDCSADLVFEDYGGAFSPWRQKGSGEEILTMNPSARYGVGVLFPIASTLEPASAGPGNEPISPAQDDNTESSGDALGGDALVSDRPHSGNQEMAASPPESAEASGREEDPYDLDLSLANSFKPSSMAVSFLAEFPPKSRLVVEAEGGRYKRKAVRAGNHERTWWLRTPVHIRAEFRAEDICSAAVRKVETLSTRRRNSEDLNIQIEVFTRQNKGASRLVTVCLVNRREATAHNDELCLFQSHFNATIEAPDGEPHFLPYPRPVTQDLDWEEQSLALLYRESETFAVGHGCAADWGTEARNTDRALWVSAECLPTYEAPSITPEIAREDKSLIEVSMAELAGLVPGHDGFAALSEIVESYEAWIDERRDDLTHLDGKYKSAAERHLEQCRACAERMRKGVSYLRHSADARRAFELANHAILLQQICGKYRCREIRYDPGDRRIVFSKAYDKPDPLKPPSGKGFWRPFQIAFILMAIESVGEADSPNRDRVDLLWFPTGGGKTEAYLGLAAFAMFLRRRRDPTDSGVSILTRYTLRLLTSQQFQRTSGLICAMEHIRRQFPSELGDDEFSIGIWLGGQVTPNTREGALAALRELMKGTRKEENPFILTQCPWCGARIGPISYRGKVPRAAPKLVGYEQEGKTVVFRCSDPLCQFRSRLPIYVIDEDIYERRPSLVIGTVDKFAALAWNPQARAIFGIEPDGSRKRSPPGLIIQDELHLISGPLGSMVGLYETVVEELCTDRRKPSAVKPKIVSSTATIRRYVEQIGALYARNDVTLFPPPGTSIDNSFFSRYARTEDGSLAHGKMYVGVHAPSLGSVQTAQVRTFTSLFQSPFPLRAEERDPWWTLVVFFNSLRELGTTLTLFQSDIPTRQRILKNRIGAQFSEMRFLQRDPMELTGRKGTKEVNDAIPLLQIACTDNAAQPIDVCLASNIIEVGIDIDRLSLMVVVGQPKSTSQYIQVTGRIGRLWKEHPGLVVTIYSPSKPRDRSHFEKFRSYHERLYAQVEPTSVTPFSFPAMDRALHAVMAAYVRQCGDERTAQSPSPCPNQLLANLAQILDDRVQKVDSGEISSLRWLLKKRVGQWRHWKPTRWSAALNDPNAPLLTRAGTYVDPAWQGLTWRTPTSMRNVDSQCEMEITTLYLRVAEADDE